MDYKIATELEASNIVGYSGSVVANKLCTLTRALAIGCTVDNLSRYTNNRLVRLIDLSATSSVTLTGIRLVALHPEAIILKTGCVETYTIEPIPSNATLNITTIFPGNDDLFTVDYTSGNTFTVTGLRSGLTEIGITEATLGTLFFPVYFFNTDSGTDWNLCIWDAENTYDWENPLHDGVIANAMLEMYDNNGDLVPFTNYTIEGGGTDYGLLFSLSLDGPYSDDLVVTDNVIRNSIDFYIKCENPQDWGECYPLFYFTTASYDGCYEMDLDLVELTIDVTNAYDDFEINFTVGQVSVGREGYIIGIANHPITVSNVESTDSSIFEVVSYSINNNIIYITVLGISEGSEELEVCIDQNPDRCSYPWVTVEEEAIITEGSIKASIYAEGVDFNPLTILDSLEMADYPHLTLPGYLGAKFYSYLYIPELYEYVQEDIDSVGLKSNESIGYDHSILYVNSTGDSLEPSDISNSYYNMMTTIYRPVWNGKFDGLDGFTFYELEENPFLSNDLGLICFRREPSYQWSNRSFLCNPDSIGYYSGTMHATGYVWEDLQETTYVPIVKLGFNVENKWINLGLPSGRKWAKDNLSNQYIYGNSRPFSVDDSADHDLNILTNSWDLATMDCAYINLGVEWELPTEADFQELIDNCVAEFVSDYNGVSGVIFYKAKTEADKGYIKSLIPSESVYDYNTDPHLFFERIMDIMPGDSRLHSRVDYMGSDKYLGLPPPPQDETAQPIASALLRCGDYSQNNINIYGLNVRPVLKSGY